MKMPPAQPFTIPFGASSLAGDILSNNAAADVVVLHGAGKSSRHRFYSIRERLLAHGISSLAFDMIGHGDTGGNLSESSLKDRTLQAKSVINSCKISEPLSLIGASMSGYTAIKLTQHFHVMNLILFVPAIYSRHAYSLRFDDGFSKVIREQKSWYDSDAWNILRNYKGNLLLVTAKNDDVIPKDVVRRIFKSATKSKKKVIHEVQGSPHQILGYLAERPRMFKEVISQMIRIIKKKEQS